jgi:hypothetical protein
LKALAFSSTPFWVRVHVVPSLLTTVYRFTDTKLNRDVAAKVLPPALAEDATHMARFEAKRGY